LHFEKYLKQSHAISGGYSMNHQSFNSIKNITSIALAFTSTAAWAVPIGIIDSGTDLKHEMLINHAWINPKETTGDNKDNDNNGYVDDINGWNFAENNNQIIDYSYIGKFTDDVYTYFEFHLKKIEGNASEDEIEWLEEKHKDENFIQQLMVFGNFVHGTHVAGIAAQSNFFQQK
jgi:subtilisin family serine protease